MFLVNYPVTPNAYSIMWAVIVAIVVAVAFVAIASIGRQRGTLTKAERISWIVTVVYVPLIGAIIWFTVGRRAAVAYAREHGTR